MIQNVLVLGAGSAGLIAALSIKKKIPHGPVRDEIMTTKKRSPAIETVETHTRSFTMKSETVAPSAKLNLSATTTLKLKKH